MHRIILAGQLSFYEKIALFSDPNVHLCLCPSRQKSAITFDSLDRPAQTFQGPLNSAQVIFGRMTRTHRKRGFLPNLSHPRVLGKGGGVMPILKREDGANKTLGVEF